MKLIITIPDSMWAAVQKLAAQEHTTVTALVSEGLQRLIAARRTKKSFQLRKVTFRGEGLQAHLAGADWTQIRELAYKRITS